MDQIIESIMLRLTKLERGMVDLIKPEVPRWVDWTPTVTQSVSVTFTTTFARYVLAGNTVYIRARLAITSAGTAGNTITVGGLPFSTSGNGLLGNMRVLDAGAGIYVGALITTGVTSVAGQIHQVGSVANIGVIPNFALASGDTLDIIGVYERA